ncbi:MAG: hypothetical protein IJ727_04675 [Treponema sp.]|nr:hypothetical protein [Treponema sp.]
MRMNALVVSAVMLLALAMPETGFAEIPKSEINIGGIYCGYPFSEIINRFGQPVDKTDRPPKGYTYKFRSGNSVFTVNSMGAGPIFGMHVTQGRDLLTKAGVGIGSSLADVKAIYGEPDIRIDNSNNNLIIYNTEIDEESREYFELIFSYDRSSGTVTSFAMNLLHWDMPLDEAPKRKKKSSTPQEPVKPKSTIPDKVTEIPKTELNIGWIEPGQTMSHVEEVYGKPSKIDDQGFFQIYSYNDKLVVKGKMNNGYKVTSVASYEKGVKMPNGIMVGDLYENVVKKFGAVKGIKFKGEGIEAKFKGCTDYTYFSGDKQIVFIVDKKGVIVGIRAEDLDEQKFIEAKRKK